MELTQGVAQGPLVSVDLMVQGHGHHDDPDEEIGHSQTGYELIGCYSTQFSIY